MDDAGYRRPAFARYRQTLHSGDLADMGLYRELAVREYGELVQRMLDDHHLGPADPLRFQAASLVTSRRELLRQLGPDIFEDPSRY